MLSSTTLTDCPEPRACRGRQSEIAPNRNPMLHHLLLPPTRQSLSVTRLDLRTLIHLDMTLSE